MSEQPRVLLLIPHLGGGGAERVTELLAHHLSRDKYDVCLAVLTGSSPNGILRPEFPVYFLEAGRVRSSAPELLALIWQLKPDLILCNMAHLNFLVLLLRPAMPMGTRVLIRQNGTASSMASEAKRPGISRFLYRRLYRLADRVICQSGAMAEDLVLTAKLARAKCAILPNPVDVDAIRSSIANHCESADWSGPHLVAVGRLSHEKGFDLLLEAFSQLLRVFPKADLVIAGRGKEESSLKARCRALGIERFVRFEGHIKEPTLLFPGATLFVVPSRHEGIPNAMVEAAAAGLPIVATPASRGMVDLLQGQPGVWVAQDVSSAALAESLSVATLSLHPGQHFLHAWVEPFRLRNSIPAYERLIDSCLSTARK